MDTKAAGEVKILNIPDPIDCAIVERVNRFVVGVEREGTYYHTATNNTGRLRQFIIGGRKAFCLSHDRPGKTDYRLFVIEDKGQGAVIDTQLQMRALEKAAEMQLIP